VGLEKEIATVAKKGAGADVAEFSTKKGLGENTPHREKVLSYSRQWGGETRRPAGRVSTSGTSIDPVLYRGDMV